MALKILPGVFLALGLAFLGQYLSEFIGVTLMGLPKSPISAIMLAIVLGILVSNQVSLPELFKPGIRFRLVHILRIWIVLLGIRLSLAEAGAIGLQSLPIIIGAVVTALVVVTYFGRKMGLSGRLGVLIAGGTSICGATAIVAMAPAVAPRWYSMIPLFVVGFAAMSLVRTIGDSGEMAFGVLQQDQWASIVSVIKHRAEICLAVAMAAVGLGTSIRGLQSIGFRPLAVGLFSALLVGAVSIALILLMHG
ncbi:MAG: putative sulfate exporter family transporter [Pseudomonadota bacterium]